MKSFILATSFLLIVCLGCIGDNSSVATDTGYETPEAVFAAFQKASEALDYPAAISMMTDESKQAMAGVYVFALGFKAALEKESAGQVDELLSRHGITKEMRKNGPQGMDPNAGADEMLRSLGSMPKDPAKFIPDALNLLEESADNEEQAFSMGTLGDVKIDGDSASAIVTTKESKEKPIEFRKNKTGWLVHFPAEAFDMGD